MERLQPLARLLTPSALQTDGVKAKMCLLPHLSAVGFSIPCSGKRRSALEPGSFHVSRVRNDGWRRGFSRYLLT